MNSLEIIDKKEQLQLRAKELVDNAKKEERKLNEDESREFDSINDEIRKLNDEYRKLSNDLNNTKTINKTMKSFSLLKAINDVANHRSLDETANAINEAGIAEMRKAGQSFSGLIILPVEERATIQATVATAGEENVPEDKLNILEPLRAKMVLSQAGATYMTGLTGNISIPTYSGSTVGWAGEVNTASDGAGTFGEITLEPKRLTAYIDVSKQFLIQDSNDAEAMLKRDIVNALADKLEATILGSAAGDSTKPAGIFNGAGNFTATYAGVVGMEQALEEANVNGNFTFIVSPAIKATLKTTEKASNTAKFLMEGNEVDGLPVLSTSNAKGIVLGDFSDYVIAQWGGIDLTIDPYTQAANGKVRIVINAYFDAKPRRSDAFVAKVVSA